MRITNVRPDLLAEIEYLNAGRRQGDMSVELLPVHSAVVEGLPSYLDGLIVTADLQGRETFESSQGRLPRLLGEVIPERLSGLIADLGHDPNRFGVILAGDFYTVPGLDRRGGSGDVTRVWQSFSWEFNFVVGVAGNHDSFQDGDRKGRPLFQPPLYFLDGTTITVDQLIFGGISGIIGNPSRPWRRSLEDYCDVFKQIADSVPDLIVVHDGPNDPAGKQRGSDAVRRVLELSPPSSLTVRGHAHWRQPLVEYKNGQQILNADSRVFILTKE